MMLEYVAPALAEKRQLLASGDMFLGRFNFYLEGVAIYNCVIEVKQNGFVPGMGTFKVYKKEAVNV